MTYTAADVPSRVDVLIAGEGYRFLETDEVKGISSFAPTFLQRTNVSDAYGDEDQDWWLTMSQKDWSLGEGQRYFTVGDEDAQRRYWQSTGVDLRWPGELRMYPTTTAITTAAAVVCSYGTGTNLTYYATSTNVYSLADDGTIVDLGAHGLAGSPASGGAMVVDPSGDIYITDGASVRKYSGSWGNFDATNGATHLAYLNNTLYGLTTSALYRWSTGGTRSTIFTWQGADGGAASMVLARSRALAPFGGDLAILFRTGSTLGEIWIYDGVAPAKVAELPGAFSESEIMASNGALFVSGSQTRPVPSGSGYRPTVYVYTNGTLTKLWQSDEESLPSGTTSTDASVVVMCPWRDGIVWTDNADGRLIFYDPTTGAINGIANVGVDASTTTRTLASAGPWFHFQKVSGTSGVIFPATTYPTSATIQLSLFAGETTREKRFKSVVVEWEGSGTSSVDIAYGLDEIADGTTSVQTGAVSGTEYAIGANGRAITIHLTLNKGNSTDGPRVKRVYVRAAPLLDTFRKERYVLDLTGVDGDQHIQMRDGETRHPKDGLAMATDLRTAIASTTPVTIVDEFGSYTAYLVPEECEIRRIRSQEYVAIITARQV